MPSDHLPRYLGTIWSTLYLNVIVRQCSNAAHVNSCACSAVRVLTLTFVTLQLDYKRMPQELCEQPSINLSMLCRPVKPQQCPTLKTPDRGIMRSNIQTRTTKKTKLNLTRPRQPKRTTPKPNARTAYRKLASCGNYRSKGASAAYSRLLEEAACWNGALCGSWCGSQRDQCPPPWGQTIVPKG